MKYPDFTNAKCKEIGLEFFFPEVSAVPEETKMVKRLCNSCPVLELCREWGLHHERHGIWGGLSPLQRKAIRKTRNIIVKEIISGEY